MKATSRTDSTPSNYKGIPASLTLTFAKDWVCPRISEKRFAHTLGVATVARQLALICQIDPYLAELAGWLHDACKEVKDRELLRLAQEFGMNLHPIEETNPHLLHGPVAARVVANELNLTHQPVLDAISQHTLGAAPMAPLSKVLFLSDCIDATRPVEYTKPIWQALDIDGKQNFDHAITVACDLSLKHLIDTGRPIHPKTIEVRNYYLVASRGDAMHRPG